MRQRSAIVLVVDRLGAGYLGPYGNTWVETPELNRLASQSLLVEFPIADAYELESLYRSYWFGCHALSEPAIPSRDSPTLPATLRDLRSTLLTDDPRLAALSLADDFDQRIAVAIPDATAAARNAEETQLGQFFAAALDWMSRAKHPYLLWLHTRALGGAWDAPVEYRERFRDDDDPDPPAWVHPPDKRLTKEFDPDEVLGVRQAYAGQIALLDTCVGALLDVLGESETTSDTLLVLTSPRGLAIGEHGAIGPCGDRLYGEILHTPLLLRFPDHTRASERVASLVQPHDLHSLLARWLTREKSSRAGSDASDEGSRQVFVGHGELACSVGAGQRSIRTPAWFLRESPDGIELYAKPDDRWEINEVAQLCAEVVEQLIDLLSQYESLARAGQLSDLPKLPPLLREG